MTRFPSSYPSSEAGEEYEHALTIESGVEIVPPDPVLGFVAVTCCAPNPEPHLYEGFKALENELAARAGRETRPVRASVSRE